MGPSYTAVRHVGGVLQLGDLIPDGTRVDVFREIYWAFVVLGTLVGVVVIAYTIYNAYKYRDHEGRGDDDVDRPVLGELPQGGGGGRKLFTSFGLSAIIVVSLIAWTYGTLLYVEDPGIEQENALEIDVVGYQFAWEFHYPNGHEADSSAGEALRVPANRPVELNVTSRDVFHNFGIPDLRVKTDAIPGQTTSTWFTAEAPGRYEAQCYELCGAGHSYMNATVIVMSPENYQRWYANTTAANTSA